MVLSACGGGGGDTSATPTTQTYAVRTAVGNLRSSTHSWTTVGTGSDGKSYTIAYASSPLAAGVFALTGATTGRFQSTVNIKQGTTLVGNGSPIGYYNTTDYTGLGAAYDDGRCAQATSVTALPTAAKVGDLGASADVTIYAACSTGSGTSGFVQSTWSLEADGGVAFLCSNATVQNTSRVTQATEADCIEIDAAGAIGSPVRISLAYTGGITLVTKNY